MKSSLHDTNFARPIADVKIVIRQQSNAEKRKFALVGNDLQIKPLSEPVDPTLVLVQYDFPPIRKYPHDGPGLGQFEIIDLLLRQNQVPIEARIDPRLNFARRSLFRRSNGEGEKSTTIVVNVTVHRTCIPK